MHSRVVTHYGEFGLGRIQHEGTFAAHFSIDWWLPPFSINCGSKNIVGIFRNAL